MNNPKDKRVEKTHSRLRLAFTELLMERNLDDITVFDLCEKADVRRATFYTHFKDKLDFTEYVIRALHKELGDAIQADLSVVTPCDFLMLYVKHGLALISSWESIIRNVAESSCFPAVCSLVANCTADSLASNLESARALGITLPADIDVTVNFVNAGLTYTVLNWLRKRPPPSASLYAELEKILKILFENKTNETPTVI